MKRYTFLILLALAGNCFAADPNLAGELKRLSRDREQAIATSKNAIDQMYLASLQVLLSRATQAEDRDALGAIMKAIESIAPDSQIWDNQAQPAAIGTWKFTNHTDGHTAVVALNQDFTYTVDGHRIGTWKASKDQVAVTLDRGGHVDSYSLPVKDGQLRGMNALGHALTLSLVEPKGHEEKVGEIFGSWNFTNHTDGHTAVVEVNEDRTYSEAGKRIGRWTIAARQLVISYDEFDEVDRYNLPPIDGKLNGLNKLGHALTLQRKAE